MCCSRPETEPYGGAGLCSTGRKHVAEMSQAMKGEFQGAALRNSSQRISQIPLEVSRGPFLTNCPLFYGSLASWHQGIIYLIIRGCLKTRSMAGRQKLTLHVLPRAVTGLYFKALLYLLQFVQLGHLNHLGHLLHLLLLLYLLHLRYHLCRLQLLDIGTCFTSCTCCTSCNS